MCVFLLIIINISIAEDEEKMFTHSTNLRCSLKCHLLFNTLHRDPEPSHTTVVPIHTTAAPTHTTVALFTLLLPLLIPLLHLLTPHHCCTTHTTVALFVTLLH